MNKTSRATEARSHGLVRRAAPIAAVVTLVLAVLLMGAAGGATPRESRYVGKLLGYPPPDGIRFEVERRGDRNLSATFRAKNVHLVCDNNTGPDMDFPRVSFPFLGRRVFQGQHYERQPNGDFTYYEVKGRLLSGGRAVGYLFYLDRPFDPQGTEERVGCSTGGGVTVNWRADRR